MAGWKSDGCRSGFYDDFDIVCGEAYAEPSFEQGGHGVGERLRCVDDGDDDIVLLVGVWVDAFAAGKGDSMLFVVFTALILLTKLRMEVQKVEPKQRHYWSERDPLEKVDTYTRIHFENKYKDVYTKPTVAQRDIFDFFELECCYKKNIVNSRLPVTIVHLRTVKKH